jgi:metalloendopeptidase OMA1, mitochondrial
MPESKEVSMGVSAFQELMVSETASANQKYVDMVNRVGQRIAAASERPDYDWEFRVIASDQQNAFCLPGGKVAVYEGILPVCQNEAGVAVVMSHEIAHALARHGGERMSHNVLAQVVGEGLKLSVQEREAKQRERILTAYGAVSQYGVLLPYSRKHETEADSIGLTLMARAGYDPSEAPRFWERFGAAKDGSAGPEFLSTHPSDERRADALNQQLAEANEVYAQAANQYGLGDTIGTAVRYASAETTAK